MGTARRYIVVVQAPGGYPAPNTPLEEAPTPREPTIHSAVLADDYECLEVEVKQLRKENRRLNDRVAQYANALLDACSDGHEAVRYMRSTDQEMM